MKELRMWCYKVLPLVYDDSLSYYEVLCKLKAKINEMIGVIDDIPEAVKEYLDTDEFKAYIAQLVDTLKGGFVSVDDFGAKGDGLTNDRDSFEEAFNAAYELGLPVIASGSKTYVIDSTENSVVIKNSFNGNGCKIKVLNIGETNVFRIKNDFKDISISHTQFTRERTFDSRLFGKVIYVSSPLSMGPRYGQEGMPNIYHEQCLLVDKQGFFVNCPYYPDIVEGTYNVRYDDALIPTIKIENINFVTDETAICQIIRCDRPNVDFENIVCDGSSAVTGYEHNTLINIFTISYNIHIKNISGYGPYDVSGSVVNTGYVLGLYGGSNIEVDSINQVGITDGNPWSFIGISRACNYMFKNCEGIRFDSHYETFGNNTFENCGVYEIGLCGGWGNVDIKNCTVYQSPYRPTNQAITFRNDTPLPFSGYINIERITVVGKPRLINLSLTNELPNEGYFNLSKMCLCIKDVEFTNESGSIPVIIVNDPYSYIWKIKVENCYFSTYHMNVRANAENCELIFEKCRFYDGVIFTSGKVHWLTFNQCSIPTEYAGFTDTFSCDLMRFDGCIINSVLEDNIDTNIFILVNCVILTKWGMNVTFDHEVMNNNLCVGENNHENQAAWNNVLI